MIGFLVQTHGCSLQKDVKERPTPAELLEHPFLLTAAKAEEDEREFNTAAWVRTVLNQV